jgi:hypothetical protein
MKLPNWLSMVCLTFLCGLLASQTAVPGRTVRRNVITSKRDPSVRIILPEDVHYLGADRWVLYGIADCELHAFVEADAQNIGAQNNNVHQLYWVQFEQYLPAKPDLHHTYDSLRHVQIGGMDFYVDTWVRPSTAPIDPGSDREHIETLVRQKGYVMPAGMMYVRLVHLLDEQKRKELMIIYGEDLASTGFSAAELGEEGKAHDHWAKIAKGLIERAEHKIVIEQTSRDHLP